MNLGIDLGFNISLVADTASTLPTAPYNCNRVWSHRSPTRLLTIANNLSTANLFSSHVEDSVDSREVKVGDVIMREREAAGLSRQQLAEKAGVSRVYIWQVETGVRSISLEVFIQIAAALDLKASALMSRIEAAIT